jgi:hypothetical protein
MGKRSPTALPTSTGKRQVELDTERQSAVFTHNWTNIGMTVQLAHDLRQTHGRHWLWPK